MAVCREISIGSAMAGHAPGRPAPFLSEIGWMAAARRLHKASRLIGAKPMARAYYSTVLDRPAPDVWEIIRDFNNYPVWVGGAGESEIEDGKSGMTVGAVRNVLYQGQGGRGRQLWGGRQTQCRKHTHV